VFTYSMDYLAGTIDTPLVVAVVNFEGGGRWLGMMTDREISEVRIGMPVELTFRKLRTVGGVHNYYWKCMPVRA
jgi:hydroxymethylglutaryl-CoA synthase